MSIEVMDPPPFNFNTTANTSGKTQPAPSAFGTAVPKATFGSLFGKPSLLSQAAKREVGKTTEAKESAILAPSNSLASRLTVVKNKDSAFKAQGDSTDGKVPSIQEGAFAIRPRLRTGKTAVGPYVPTRRGREGTPEGSENKFANVLKNPLDAKPVQQAQKVGFNFGRQNTEARSLFNKQRPIIEEDSVDETDHAVKKEAQTSMFGVPLATSSMKGFGSMPTAQEKHGLSVKPLGDKTWKFVPSRSSPVPENRPNKSSGSEEGKLIQRLAALRNQFCQGDYEKYVLLDERDKILCLLREVDSPLIRKLERCEEMCTEKERYQRIVQKGVSPFECAVETGEVSHEMMVKQYARSAADQERPLPHELRSEKIMDHAMCYLLHNILDEFPETADQRAAWYNFLWNRTRALRKEVTQLSLSDSLALNLVERCTRLHILFGYVLCDLETEHFDTAMNNETLGKCLQTLRHFYEDFEKRGIPCVNEPEFRSYDVMLHMNDTNVLSQVLSYRSEVRQSHPVRLSLQLAAAFRDNNYCRFFRLLQTEASYLQCCVAHKLFAATRRTAISIMANSYGRSTFPLDKLKRMLAFDNNEDLTIMVNICGLRTEDSDNVILNKEDLTLNETVPLHTHKWIDAKNTGKLSNIVYGSDLFQFIASRCDVSNSFNHRNEYTNDKVLEMVLSGSDIPVTNNSAFSFTQSAGSLSMQATMEQRKKQEAERMKKVEEAQREKLVQKLMTGVIDQVVQGIVHEEVMKANMVRKQMMAFEKARKLREEQERMKMEMELKRKEKEQEVARNLAMKIEKAVAEKELKKIVADEFMRERRIRERKLAHIIVEKFWREILKSVDSHVRSICDDMVNEKEIIMEGLDTFRDRMAKQWLLQFWNRWRDWVQLKKEVKTRKLEMIRRCVPRWESEEVANNLVRKYGSDSQQTSPEWPNLDRPANNYQLTIFKRNRQNRIVRDAFKKWRDYSMKKKSLKRLAEDRQKRENEFYQRFEKSARIETRFKFDAPVDCMKKKRRKSDTLLDRSTDYDHHNLSFHSPNTSLFVARRHLEDWEPATEVSNDLREKMKRKRESFEKVCEDHILKKKKDEELLSNEVKTNNVHMKKVAGEADALLDETLRYTAELEQMMAAIKSRRVDDL